MFCTKCGNERRTQEPFCGNCGVRLTRSDWKLPSEVSTHSPDSGKSELKKSSIAPMSIILSVLLVIGVSTWFLVDQFSPGTNSQNIEIPQNLPPSSPKKSDNFALACAAWSKGDNRTFAEYLALLVKEGSKYQEFVNVGFEHVTPHMTNPNGTGPSVYDLQQNINARNRILSAYCN